MLPKKERLKESQKIQQTLRRGQKFNSLSFWLYFLPANRFEAAIIISRKTARQAVCRNLIKRRFAAALGEVKNDLKLIGGFVFIIKGAIIEKDYRAIKEEIFLCLKKLA